MKKSSKNRKWKSLSLKIQHLQLELEEREEALRSYEEEFLSTLSSLQIDDVTSSKDKSIIEPHVTIIDKSVKDDQIIDSPPPVEGPEEMKQLWRSIAVNTHPDKTQGDEEKSDFYKRANEAWRNGNYSELYKIAMILDIEPPDTEVTYLKLEEISSDLERKISEKEKSVLWEWGKAQGEEKNRILDLYLASKGKKKKSKI